MSKRRVTSSKRAVGDPAGGPLLFEELGHGMAELLRLQGSPMADPHGRAPLLRRAGGGGRGVWGVVGGAGGFGCFFFFFFFFFFLFFFFLKQHPYFFFS